MGHTVQNITLFLFSSCRGTPGDLYVYLDIEEIPEIQRDGINLTSTVTINYLDAILGTIVKVKFTTAQMIGRNIFLVSSAGRYAVVIKGDCFETRC